MGLLMSTPAGDKGDAVAGGPQVAEQRQGRLYRRRLPPQLPLSAQRVRQNLNSRHMFVRTSSQGRAQPDGCC